MPNGFQVEPFNNVQKSSLHTYVIFVYILAPLDLNIQWVKFVTESFLQSLIKC